MTSATLPAPHQLVKSLEDASLSLQDALATHAGAVVQLAEAKGRYEEAKAYRLAEGLKGKNAEQRKAFITILLQEERDAMHQAEQALTEARCALDCARIDWDLARYTVRALELGA